MEKLALLSVSDKRGLVEFATALVQKHGFRLLSTGGTAKLLAEKGLPVSEVAMGEPAGRDRWVVEHDGRAYAVFVHSGGFTVTDAGCPHRGGPLVAGTIRDGTIVCPWHWYAYDLATGACRNAVGFALTTYTTHSRDGQLYAEIEPRPTVSWSQRLRAHARSHDE